MDDLISRQAAIDALDQIFDRCEEIEVHLPEGDPDGTGYKMYPDYMIVWKYLHQLPSAQTEIVRCKDCKYYTSVTAQCEIRGKGLYLIRGLDDFCSKAERRSDERFNQQTGGY